MKIEIDKEIDKEISDSKERSLKLRNDIDGILDMINALNDTKKAKGLSVKSIKEVDKNIAAFRAFFDDFSKMLADSEKITKSYENIKESMPNNFHNFP